MDDQRKEKALKKEKPASPEKDWDNPKNPEGTTDQRDIEQLERQKEEAKRRKENLSSDEN